MKAPTLVVLLAGLAVCGAPLTAQSNQTVIPSGLGFESKLAGGAIHTGFSGRQPTYAWTLYSTAAIGIPDDSVLREIAFRPAKNSVHSAKLTVAVFLGFPAAGVVPERMLGSGCGSDLRGARNCHAPSRAADVSTSYSVQLALHWNSDMAQELR